MTTTEVTSIEVTSSTLPPGFVTRLEHIAQAAILAVPNVVSPDQVHYATFGLDYGRLPHPTLGIVDPRSSIRVEGVDAESARAAVFAVTEGAFAFMYDQFRFKSENHPIAPILSIVVR